MNPGGTGCGTVGGGEKYELMSALKHSFYRDTITVQKQKP